MEQTDNVSTASSKENQITQEENVGKNSQMDSSESTQNPAFTTESGPSNQVIDVTTMVSKEDYGSSASLTEFISELPVIIAEGDLNIPNEPLNDPTKPPGSIASGGSKEIILIEIADTGSDMTKQNLNVEKLTIRPEQPCIAEEASPNIISTTTSNVVAGSSDSIEKTILLTHSQPPNSKNSMDVDQPTAVSKAVLNSIDNNTGITSDSANSNELTDLIESSNFLTNVDVLIDSSSENNLTSASHSVHKPVTENLLSLEELNALCSPQIAVNNDNKEKDAPSSSKNVNSLKSDKDTINSTRSLKRSLLTEKDASSTSKIIKHSLLSNSGTYTEKSFTKKSAQKTDSTVLRSELEKCKRVNIYTEYNGPKWYDTHGNMYNISRPVVPKKLLEAFKYLPIFGQPKSKSDIPKFHYKTIRDYVGSILNNEEYSQLIEHCSTDHLLTGKELTLTDTPGAGIFTDLVVGNTEDEQPDESELKVTKKYKMRIEKDEKNAFSKRLKYRGIRFMPLSFDNEEQSPGPSTLLEPGVDLIFRVRIYRPFTYSKQRAYRGRHSVFSRDLVLTGRQTLTDLRDRIVCANDFDMRFDVSDRIDELPTSSAKELFPSGFLFINNVFYVDNRPGCKDTSQCIRNWAASKAGMGKFPKVDMGSVRLDELNIMLGHPEVYVHQGNCEHLFTFSEIRLLGPTDPPRLSQYPCHTAISQNQTVYCGTCAEYGAKWIVTGCTTVPFDPAFFCDTCFRLYLYKDGKKVCNFKAYSYRSNEINVLKPQG